MPCNCDHLEATHAERDSKEVCEHLKYLGERLVKAMPHWVMEGAKDYYGAVSHLEEGTIMLCELCQECPEEIIYNARDRRARRLADWWEEHQEADRVRILKENATKTHLAMP